MPYEICPDCGAYAGITQGGMICPTEGCAYSWEGGPPAWPTPKAEAEASAAAAAWVRESLETKHYPGPEKIEEHRPQYFHPIGRPSWEGPTGPVDLRAPRFRGDEEYIVFTGNNLRDWFLNQLSRS